MDIIGQLRWHTDHPYVALTLRGNAAIEAALKAVSGTIIIPAEGGWLSYRSLPRKLGQKIREVSCDDARINLQDLEEHLQQEQCAALLYQNPGGYFATQPLAEIYTLCQKYHCLVILDVSGSLGTPLCQGRYADIMISSFREGKLVDAGTGGFISAKNRQIWQKITVSEPSADAKQKIALALEQLPQRLHFLQERIQKIKTDLASFDIVHPQDESFVVVIKYNTEEEKEKIINYGHTNNIEFTECPRYIRLNKPAISLEVKRLHDL